MLKTKLNCSECYDARTDSTPLALQLNFGIHRSAVTPRNQFVSMFVSQFTDRYVKLYCFGQ